MLLRLFFTLDNLELKGIGVAPALNIVFPNPSKNAVHINLAIDGKGFANIVNGLAKSFHESLFYQVPIRFIFILCRREFIFCKFSKVTTRPLLINL
jgi:hypothetical protein